MSILTIAQYDETLNNKKCVRLADFNDDMNSTINKITLDVSNIFFDINEKRSFFDAGRKKSLCQEHHCHVIQRYHWRQEI